MGTLEPLTAADRAELRTAEAGTARDVADGTVADRFAEQAAATPDACAVVCGPDRLTFAELDERADRLAALLAARGAGPESVVALAVPRSAASVVAVLAVLKSGAAYLPLDLDYPADRIALMLDDAAPVCVLTTEAALALLPSGAADGPERIVLDSAETAAELAALGQGFPRRASSPGTPPT